MWNGSMDGLLLEHIRDSVRHTVGESRIGVAFSGGVDSTMIARVCADLNYDATLLTVGFPDSHDVLFARRINEILKMPHEVLEIDPDTFARVAQKVQKTTRTENLSWNENSIAFYYVSKLAKSVGLDTVVTANGIDELFCGYDAYRGALSGGERHVLDLMAAKVANETDMMRTVNAVASEFGVRILQPLLAEKFVKYAMGIPLSEKIRNPDDLLRKHAIRRLAMDIGVPALSAEKRKKALQYGTKIHKALLKTR